MTINYVAQPSITSYMMFADFKLQEALAAKRVNVTIHDHTKTRFSVSFYFGETTTNVNIIPEGSAGLKFHSEQRTSYYDGKTRTVSYFIKSKKQNMAAMETHIKNVVAHVFGISVNDEFTIDIYESTAVRMLRAA